jgi:hypothetical protein
MYVKIVEKEELLLLTLNATGGLAYTCPRHVLRRVSKFILFYRIEWYDGWCQMPYDVFERRTGSGSNTNRAMSNHTHLDLGFYYRYTIGEQATLLLLLLLICSHRDRAKLRHVPTASKTSPGPTKGRRREPKKGGSHKSAGL